VRCLGRALLSCEFYGFWGAWFYGVLNTFTQIQIIRYAIHVNVSTILHGQFDVEESHCIHMQSFLVSAVPFIFLKTNCSQINILLYTVYMLIS
jgi:hypothetical protein